MHLISMTTRSEFAARSSFRGILALALAFALVEANAQSPTVAPESSAARNLLAPSPPPVSTGPSGTTNSVTAPSGYVLSANDQVAIEVFGEDDLRTNGRLNGEGNLSVPLLGSIHLAGLTLTQAASRLTDFYARDYLVNPRVNVMLVGYAKRRFTMLGQINRPGSYEMPDGSPEGIDLMEAVAMAGGYTRIAAPERISVRRHSNSGKHEIIRVDAKRLARGDRGNFTVLPGDAITVGESIF